VNAIASAASQQETGISQTNKAMQQMDLVTNKNLKRAAEAAQAGKRLEDQYGLLADAIDSLNQIIFGVGNSTAAAESASKASKGKGSGGKGGSSSPQGGGDADPAPEARSSGKVAKVSRLVPKERAGKKSSAVASESLPAESRLSNLEEDPSIINGLPSPDDARFG